MTPTNSEQATERLNDCLDAIREMHERFENRLRFGNLRLAERYVKGELNLLVHFRVMGTKVLLENSAREVLGGLASIPAPQAVLHGGISPSRAGV